MSRSSRSLPRKAHEPSAPQVQTNGLYWENERMICEAETELRCLSEQRRQQLQLFRLREERTTELLNGLLEKRKGFGIVREGL